MITVNQNAYLQLDRLAAMRQLYSDAKSTHAIQFIGSVIIVGALSFGVIADARLRPWAALWSLSFTIVDLVWLDSRVKALRSTAARIQELFDCDVLLLEWNDLRVGRRPDREEVFEAGKRHKSKNKQWEKDLRDWYPVAVAETSFEFGRIISQRSSCRWDADIRRQYATALGRGLGILALIGIVVSVIADATVTNFILSGIAPVVPLVSFGTRQLREQREAADRSERLKSHLDQLWERALLGQLADYGNAARSVQDALFEHRSKSPLVFDWIYKLQKRNKQEAMDEAAQQLVAEAKRRRGRIANG